MDPESPPRDVELSALEAEKEPMAAAAAAEAEPGTPPHPPSPHRDPIPAPESRPGGEKNGLVMKIPPEEEEEAALGGGDASGSPKFTGLGKEELLREAGTPMWARARLVLLVLFWGGWIGMLGAAAAIVAQAPRCQPLPTKSWWELGALYRAPPKAFGGNLKGVEERLGYLKEKLQVGGLVLGPVYPQKSPEAKIPPLKELDPALGTIQDFSALLQSAKDKGLKVILDLTPNPSGGAVWGEAALDPEVHQQVQAALIHWLKEDIAGVFLDGIEELRPSLVAEWRNLTEQQPSPSGVARVLVGGTRLQEPWKLLQDPSGPQLLLGPFLSPLEPKAGSEPPEKALRNLVSYFNSSLMVLGWSVGSPWEAWVSPDFSLQQLLLVWGLPGTPVLSYGDEVRLQRPPKNEKLPPMPWEFIEGLKKGGNASELPRELELCRALAALRARERSLLLGEARAVPAGSAVAVLRRWDQSERFLLLLNPLGTAVKPFPAPRDPREPPEPPLPARASLRLSTQRAVPASPELLLEELTLAAHEGVLLSFPYTPQ